MGNGITFATHGYIDYTINGHSVQIWQRYNDEDVLEEGSYFRAYYSYSVQVDDVNHEGYIYSTQQEAREVAAHRSRFRR